MHKMFQMKVSFLYIISLSPTFLIITVDILCKSLIITKFLCQKVCESVWKCIRASVTKAEARVVDGAGKPSTAWDCPHLYMFVLLCVGFTGSIGAIEKNGWQRIWQCSWTPLRENACGSKPLLSKLNKERWHRGGEHQWEQYNQLSHKLRENLPAFLADFTACWLLTIFI